MRGGCKLMNNRKLPLSGTSRNSSQKTVLPEKRQGRANVASATKATKPLHSGSGIVPSETIAGNALLVVIAIMAFLACLTLGTVLLVNNSASDWQNDISREVTIQIRPSDDFEMEQAIQEASRVALTFPGINQVTELTDEAAGELLEPWLGSGLQLDELPVPKLLIVTLEPESNPDLQGLSVAIANQVPSASLDDHRAWVDQLSSMAWIMVLAGSVIFALVMAATILTVVFATRGAMAGNKDVVEVLHFVGADSTYIARQFQRHFLLLGLKGACIGGALAIIGFVFLGFWTAFSPGVVDGDQISFFLGSFALGWAGYAGILLVLILIAGLTALTSRLTVINHVNRLYSYRR